MACYIVVLLNYCFFSGLGGQTFLGELYVSPNGDPNDFNTIISEWVDFIPGVKSNMARV